LCELGDSLGLGRAAELDDVFAVDAPRTAEHVADYLRRASNRDDRPSGIEMDSRGYLIAVELLRHLKARRQPLLRPASALPPHRLRRVVELIEARLDTSLRLSDLASAAGLSPFHFSRAFKRTTDLTPTAYIMRRRVERAAELSRLTQLALAEIAHRTGFSSQSHMTRAVKAQFGETPGAMRRGQS
jgi:AraC family transcriptional regulator